jgi:type I restriction enzyme S subunit
MGLGLDVFRGLGMSGIAIQWCEIGDLDIHIADGNYSAKYPRSEEFLESGVPFIRANNLLDKSVSDKDMYFISPQKHDLLKKGHLQKNDVLVTTRGDLGKVALVPERHNDSNINAQLVLLRPNPQKIDPLFLLYCFEGSQVKGQVNQLQTGTALQQLPVGNLKKIKIPVPPIAEQRRIAAILDKADAIRRKRKQAIQYTEELLRATFLDMFGDPVTNPKGWEVKFLSEVLSLITYGLTVRPKYFEAGIPLVSGTQIRRGTVDLDDAPRISKEDFENLSDKAKAKAGDIFFAKTGAIGHCAILETHEEIAIAQNIARLVFNGDQVLPLFALHYLRTEYIQDLAKRQAKGNAVQDLQLGEMKKFPIPVPPIQVQEEFVKACQRIEQLTKRHVSDYDLTENLFNSLLQRAFRGEL